MKIKLSAYLFYFTVSVQPGLSQANSTLAQDINLSTYPYPFSVKYLTLSVQNQQLQMAYMDVWPAKPNGNAVVLLHGKNFNDAYRRSTADALVNEGYRVIISDQIGFGKSTQPPFFQYTFQQLCNNTKTLLDSLKINKVAVVGHSTRGNYPLPGHITQSKIKGSKLVELANTGHFPHIESFEKFINTLTLFLKAP